MSCQLQRRGFSVMGLFSRKVRTFSRKTGRINPPWTQKFITSNSEELSRETCHDTLMAKSGLECL